MATETQTRRMKALELHLAGATYELIAEQLGYSDKGHAHRDVAKALADLAPDIDELGASDVARLNGIITGLWPKARRGDVQAGALVAKLIEQRRAMVADERAEETKKPEESSGGSKLARLRAVHIGETAKAG